MSSESTRPLLKFPIDIRAHVLYDAYQRISIEKSYKNYEKLCEAMGEEAISFEEYESLFNQYLEEDERELPDIRGCILSDVINGKSAKKSISDLCDAFKYHKIDEEDHGYWFKRFENGHLFSSVTFSDFPEDIVAEIVGKCDIKSYLSLREVSDSLRVIIDQIAPPCSDIKVVAAYDRINVTVDDACMKDSYDSVKANSHLQMETSETRILKTLAVLVRNPKLRLKSFKLYNYLGFPLAFVRVGSGIEITELNYRKMFFDSLSSLDHKIHTEKCSIDVGNEQDVVEVLQCFKPGTLKELEIITTSLRESMHEIVKMDQWKQAKHLKTAYFMLPPIENFFHFTTIELNYQSISTEEFVKLCENASKSISFESCTMTTENHMDTTIKRVLNLQPTASPEVYSIPNTNLAIQFFMNRVAYESLKIYKN